MLVEEEYELIIQLRIKNIDQNLNTHKTKAKPHLAYHYSYTSVAIAELFSGSLLGVYLPMKLPSSSMTAATKGNISRAQRGMQTVGNLGLQTYYLVAIWI